MPGVSALQLGKALDELGQTGFFHGDVSPAIIVICDNGKANLIDLATVRHSEQVCASTSAAALSSCTPCGM